MPNRSLDWFQQARRDLEQAQASQNEARHEWACFAAHQAAEKAVKALHLFYNQEAWGHLVARLLSELPPQSAVPPLLIEQAKVLDNFYIPTRYPDSHPAGSPFEHYGFLQSEEAVRHASAIVEFVSHAMAEPGGS
jgi:HEPN domain-containing protein